MGVALDVLVYHFVIRWQPPWLTFALALAEFVLLFVIVKTLRPGHPGFGEPDSLPGAADWHPVLLFWVSWVLAVWTKIAALPLVNISWIENGGELRRCDWTIQPRHESVPVVAVPAPDPHASAVVREVSADFPDAEPHVRQPAPAAARTPRQAERKPGVRYAARARPRMT